MFLSIDKSPKIYELVERAIQRGFLYHFFFWLVFFFFLIIMDTSDASLAEKIVSKFLRIDFYVVVVYSNMNVLFPRYLKKNKLLLYVIFLLLVVLIATPIEVALHYLIFGGEFSEVFTLKNNARYFLGGFFIAFSSSIYKIISDWVEHQRERQELHRQNLRSELKFLKTQINPHFFFNTLNSLYALTLKKSDKAPEIVLKLSEMMRYMLYESNERTIPLAQEINYINNYLELEKLRHGDNFEIDMSLEGDPAGHHIAPLLFIPFLENCFKHGIDHELKSGYVNIHVDIEKDGLKLRVENSKPKKVIERPSDGKKSGGIGLTNVRRRLNILYPSRYTLDIDESDKTFAVIMTLKGTRSAAMPDSQR